MIKVLFVDDDKVTQKLVKEILSGAGYSVVVSDDPRDAFEKLNIEPFDVVLTDINIPGGFSGFAFVKTMRSYPKFQKMPIAMITGRRDKKDIQLGLECGADDYILKPIDPMILISKVESLVKKTGVTSNIQFPEGPVRQKAVWNVEAEINYVSERGLTLSSPVSAVEDAKMRINSEFFNQIGIQPPLLRVVSCTKNPVNSHLYEIKTTFIGLNDSELQKIRGWLNVKFNPSKKTA